MILTKLNYFVKTAKDKTTVPMKIDHTLGFISIKKRILLQQICCLKPHTAFAPLCPAVFTGLCELTETCRLSHGLIAFV